MTNYTKFRRQTQYLDKLHKIQTTYTKFRQTTQDLDKKRNIQTNYTRFRRQTQNSDKLHKIQTRNAIFRQTTQNLDDIHKIQTNYIKFRRQHKIQTNYTKFNPYNFATKCCRPQIFHTMNSVRSNILSRKSRFTPSGCKDIRIRKSDFDTKLSSFLNIV